MIYSDWDDDEPMSDKYIASCPLEYDYDSCNATLEEATTRLDASRLLWTEMSYKKDVHNPGYICRRKMNGKYTFSASDFSFKYGVP